MTIVTKPLTDEKKDLKPLVVDGENGNFPASPVDGQDGVSTTSDITVYQHPYRKHRTGFLVCLGLLIVLIIACATMGGIYLYYRFSQPEGYRGSCRIRFSNQANSANLISPFDAPTSALQSPPFQSPSFPVANDLLTPTFQPARNRMLFPQRDDSSSSGSGDIDSDLQRIINSFQQDFELDLRKQLWEILQVPRVPQLGLGRPARFIHDFSLNLTAIFDMASQECYIMPLNRSVIKPPQDLFEFLRGLEDGSYTVDGTAVRQTYYVDPLPVMDLSGLGPFIERECNNHPTYWLISRDADSDRVRRNADQVNTFGEFVGSLHTVDIIKNL